MWTGGPPAQHQREGQAEREWITLPESTKRHLSDGLQPEAMKMVLFVNFSRNPGRLAADEAVLWP
jgi:hypothetical protein